MGVVAQCKVCLRALDLMLADDLTAADADRHVAQAVHTIRGFELPEVMPRSTLKKLVQELKVPFHLATACSRAAQRCPWSDAAYAAMNALLKFLCRFERDDPASPARCGSSSSLSAHLAQQLLRSGLLQHLPALLQATAAHAQALAQATITSRARPGCAQVNQGASGSSSSSSNSSNSSSGNSGSSCGGGDSIAPTSHVDEDHVNRHMMQCLEVSQLVIATMSAQQVAPYFCPLAASMLQLALASLQFGSSQVQGLQQQQKQQQGHSRLTQLVCLHAAIANISRMIARIVYDNFRAAADLQQLPGAEALLQSPHTQLCLAAAAVVECGALAASQQGMAPDWGDEGAAAVHCWKLSCRTADSLSIAERLLQQALGLEAQAVRFAVLCAQPGTALVPTQALLMVHRTVLMAQAQAQQQQQQQAAMHQHAQCGLLVPAAVCQLTAVLVQQATSEVWKFTAAAAWWSATFVDAWATAKQQVQQPASPGSKKRSGQLVHAVLPAGYVDDVLPLVLSAAAHLQQELSTGAPVATSSAVGTSGAPQVAAYHAYNSVCRMLVSLVRHASAVRSSSSRPPKHASAGTAAAAAVAAAAAAGSGSALVSSSSHSPAGGPAACEVLAGQPAGLTQPWSADVPWQRGEGVTPSGLSAHVVQVLAALQGLVRLTASVTAAAAAAGQDYTLGALLPELHRSTLVAVELLCMGGNPGRVPLLALVVGAEGSSRAVAEVPLQGLLVSLLKLHAAAALLPEETLGFSEAYRVVALAAAAAALSAAGGAGGDAAGGGSRTAAADCPEAGSKNILQEDEGAAAAATSAVCCGDISSMLPCLVAFGRLSLQWSEGLQQLVLAGAEAHSAPAAAAASSHGSSSTSGCGLTTAELGLWLNACHAVCGYRGLLQQAGYDEQFLKFRTAYTHALAMEAHGGVGSGPVAVEHLPQLAQQMAEVGQVLASLATPVMCNNATCSNVSGPSEQQLVSGRSCICTGCRTARYCSRACQKQHWKQHKAVCKALAAAVAVDVAGTSTAAAAAAVPPVSQKKECLWVTGLLSK